MPPKANPSKLNPLQLRTLTLLQAIAQIPGASNPTPEGDTAITQFPHAHGDHFHLGDATVAPATPPAWKTRMCGTRSAARG